MYYFFTIKTWSWNHKEQQKRKFWYLMLGSGSGIRNKRSRIRNTGWFLKDLLQLSPYALQIRFWATWWSFYFFFLTNSDFPLIQAYSTLPI
jgi:hypothetical protein